MKRVLWVAALCLPTPAFAQIYNPPVLPDMSNIATKAEVAAVQATVPTPAVTSPPGVADSSATGTGTGVYALWNHTHASKARKGRVTTLADGTQTMP